MMATATETTRTAHYSPSVDIIERETEFVVYADMPGVDGHSVDVTLDKDVLTVYGTVKAEAKAEGDAHEEYVAADYKRIFTLGAKIDRDAIGASVKHGVLTLVLPKAAELQPRKIEIASA
jgi:HSP20 family molecular chaperone IbpA